MNLTFTAPDGQVETTFAILEGRGSGRNDRI